MNRHIDEYLLERYEDITKLYDNMQGKWTLADYRIAIFSLLDNGCFCPDCLFYQLEAQE